MEIVEQFFIQLNKKNQRFRRSVAFLTVLSLLVVLGVSWNLRQTGVAFANDAGCGREEHMHTEECVAEKILICGLETEGSIESSTEDASETPTEEATELTTEEVTEEASTEAPTEESTEMPTEEVTEAPTEEPTETPTEEITEEPTEEPTEAPTEAPTEESEEAGEAAQSEEPEEAGIAAQSDESEEDPTEALEEEAVETAADVVMSVAADVLSFFIPSVQAAEIPEETAAAEEASTHIHTDECYEIIYQCGLEEHIHDFSCYSDNSADVEDWSIWTECIPELTGWISDDIVLVAQSQLGYTESELNFELAEDGETRNGITRYGQWYGNPYGPWSNMFTSFCLRFAGLENVPVNSGAERMQMDWEELNLYRHAGGYEPVAGDIVFLDKNQNGTPETTGVVVRYFDFVLTVIEGDVDNAVVQTEYMIDDPVINGYGITNAANKLMMFAAGAPRASVTIGKTLNYPNKAGTYILYANVDGNYYALDVDGKAVQVSIDKGNIIADVDDPATLYWVFSGSNNSYSIQNASNANVYLTPGANGLLSATSRNVSLSGNNNGAKFYTSTSTGWPSYTTTYYNIQFANNTFGISNNSGTTLYFGQAPTRYTVWLDGTNGGTMSYSDSDNTAYSAYSGIPMQLPTEWKSPTKYQYRLVGWVDIKTGEYYEPGDSITVTEDMVLYADWVAASYDIGQDNDNVVRTSSTSDFITTYLFDYNALINLMSTKATVTVDANSHSETWAHVSEGDATYAGQTTLDFSFVDDNWEGSYDNKLDDPSDRSPRNQWTGDQPGEAYTGIVGKLGDYVRDNRVITTLFSTKNAYNHETGEGIIGKNYLGTGDHLFQYNEDTGYYYYDAQLNAASYNQSEGRFYIYDYLERSSDSPDKQSYSDFLPLNSPYANTGNSVTSGTRDNVAYYEYDARMGDASSTRAEWLYGMRTDINFGLPDDAGEGNRDINGNEMNFMFTGDDDVWILIDGKLVLDLGGIHLATKGEINFSTGEITAYKCDGKVDYEAKLQDYDIKAGEHTLTILYLERGASMANCAIYFNLAPRFAIELRKEDVLTQNLLDGAQFAFYTDPSCAKGTECELWSSYESYMNDDEPGYIFTAHFGKAFVWGLNPSTTYYIKEVKSPSGDYFEATSGVIKVTLSKVGMNSYGAEILPDANGNITNGFNVHGFSVDEEAQIFYLHITNAQNWVEHTTSVYVEKEWNDNKNHDADAVTVYLNVTDRDGTVRTLRQIDLCKENNWKYTWSNLPLYRQDPTTGEEDTSSLYTYSVEEAYVSGYQQVIRPLQSTSNITQPWSESSKFENGGVYLLKFGNNYLSSEKNNNDKLKFVNEATAKSSNLALWKATVSSNLVKLTNVASGRSITFDNNKFKGATASSANQNLTQTVVDNGVLLSYNTNNKIYYMGGTINNNNVQVANQGAVITPVEKLNSADFNGYGYRVTNTPMAVETSLKVTKNWEHPFDDDFIFENQQVTFKLYRTVEGSQEPEDTGRTVTVDRYCNWTAEFMGLPYKDVFDRVYTYTVVESWDNIDWEPNYGAIQTISVSGKTPTYETTVTNQYTWASAVELPATGGIGYPIFILIGLILISAPFVYGFSLRRKRERRLPE